MLWLVGLVRVCVFIMERDFQRISYAHVYNIIHFSDSTVKIDVQSGLTATVTDLKSHSARRLVFKFHGVSNWFRLTYLMEGNVYWKAKSHQRWLHIYLMRQRLREREWGTECPNHMMSHFMRFVFDLHLIKSNKIFSFEVVKCRRRHRTFARHVKDVKNKLHLRSNWCVCCVLYALFCDFNWMKANGVIFFSGISNNRCAFRVIPGSCITLRRQLAYGI